MHLKLEFDSGVGPTCSPNTLIFKGFSRLQLFSINQSCSLMGAFFLVSRESLYVLMPKIGQTPNIVRVFYRHVGTFL